MYENKPPTLGRIVFYCGKQGFHAKRAAIVTADVNSLDARGVELGHVPALDSDRHVHLWVFTPTLTNPLGGFAEFNVPPGHAPGEWRWPEQA